MAEINLDIPILRTLVTAQDLGGFGRAAEQIGRSQSAVSLQMRKLERQLGEPLFRKQGRGLALTEAGDAVLAYARRILELNDEAVAAVRGAAIDGWVRFGMPGDFAETWLPAVLGRFKRAHPAVRIEASVDRNAVLLERLDKGQLDLALVFGGGQRGDAETLTRLPMAWIGGRERSWSAGEPVPLAVFEPPCVFRQPAIAALEATGIPWRIAFSSPSLSALWAAVDAGLGITVRTGVSLPGHLQVLGVRDGLPPLPSIDLSLHGAGRGLPRAAARLKEILLQTVPAAYPRQLGSSAA
jgi:DNA-binding transcriptional LysR family regulator